MMKYSKQSKIANNQPLNLAKKDARVYADERKLTKILFEFEGKLHLMLWLPGTGWVYQGVIEIY